MLEKAINRLVQLGNPIAQAHGRAYRGDTLAPLPSPITKPDMMNMHTLSGFCAFIMNEKDLHGCTVLVGGNDHVSYVGDIAGDFNQRLIYADTKPFIGAQFRFGQYHDPETFIVGLQSCFVQDEMTANVLKVVGNLQSEQVQTVVDDGVSQQVAAKAGIARVANIVLPNPVLLRPFRTYQEVEQPVSRFVLRAKRGDAGQMPTLALFETGDEQWKLAAVKSIKEYVTANAPGVLVLA